MALLAAALAGCSTAAPDRIDPKGSYPSAGTGNVTVKEGGELVVFGHPEPVLFRDAKETFPRKTEHFAVYDEQGRRVADLRGSRREMGSGNFDVATLPAGRYLVRSSEPHENLPQVFWVTIERHGLTAVDTHKGLRVEEEKVAPVE